MEINDSRYLYLSNYYLLEQTRNETNRFLEDIAVRFSTLFEEHIKLKSSGEISSEKWVQKGGGIVSFTLRVHNNMSQPEYMKDWKYAINYEDAMRIEDLPNPAQGRVYGFTPKGNSAQITEFKRMAMILKLPDPYRKISVELLDRPVDDVVDNLAKIFIDYYDDYIQIMAALIAEAQVAGGKTQDAS